MKRQPSKNISNRVLRLVLWDQLSHDISSLKECNIVNDLILIAELWDDATYVKHHKKKIAFLFSVMRHFAKQLQENGYKIIYITLDDQHNTGSLKGEVKRALEQHEITKIVVTHPGEYRILKDIQSWENDFNIPVEIKTDDRFLCSPERFAVWAKNRKQMRMEYFYREMRKQYCILMEDGKPVGGQWNYDYENRQPPKKGLNIPKPYYGKIDTITKEVMQLVANRFSSHFGDLEPFYFAVTRKDAIEALHLFINQRLCNFGNYQDAMIEGEPWMYHSHISFYLNCGLLLPLECIKLAEQAYYQGKAPINAVEGFIRQIMGWREYVRGIYWLKMPNYQEENFFSAKRDLPAFYWDANTKMNCLRQAILETKINAYAHHIQRLMVLGNFALLAGINPKQLNEWFLIVYADAYEWVELPNVSGMILFADGGYLASKPYAASGNYINKMSNYCKNCHYKVVKKNGDDACPFNYLYWDFLVRNKKKLQSNPRMGLVYKSYDLISKDKKQAITIDSQNLLDSLNIYI